MRNKNSPSANNVHQRDGFIILPVPVFLEAIDEDDVVVVATFVEDFGVLFVSARHCYLFTGFVVFIRMRFSRMYIRLP